MRDSTPRWRLLRVAAWFATLALLIAGEARATEAPAADQAAALCDVGIASAFHGHLDRAESLFVALLACSPRDGRALTNLGNINLMRGEAGSAMAFYERAAAADTTDAGILLNEATALLALGDTESASQVASAATHRAGGVREAARLVGFHWDGEGESSKGADRARLSQEELLGLLRSAVRGVPGDSIRKPEEGAPGTKGSPSPRPRSVWRSAGARAGDQETSALLYWKR